MPLPLLLIPVAVAAVASGTTVAAIVGSIAGLAGGAGIVGAFWMYQIESALTTPAHDESLKEQTKIIQKDIAVSKTAVDALQPQVVAVKEAVSHRLDEQNSADARYLKAVSELTHAQKALKDMTQKAVDSHAKMMAYHGELTQLMEQNKHHTTTVTKEQQVFQTVLHEKQDTLNKALEQLASVTQDVGARAKEVATLEATVTQLKHALSEQQSFITKQQQTITGLEGKLLTMSRQSFFAHQAPTQPTAPKSVESVSTPH